MVDSPRYGRRSIKTDQLARVPCCRLTNSTTQSIATATATTVLFDTAVEDRSGLKSGNAVKITTPGWYRCTAQIEWGTGFNGDALLHIINSGPATAIARARDIMSTTTIPDLTATTDYPCNAGDVLTVEIYQASGAPQTIAKVGAWSPILTVTWIGNR